VDDEYAEGLRKLGVNEADIAAQQVAAEAEPVEAAFEVHEDAWESWLFFLQVSRQWVFVVMSNGMGSTAVRQCLNWPAIEALARMSGTPRRQWPGLCADLLVIEEAVLVAECENNKG
jgi:hypothetical protein